MSSVADWAAVLSTGATLGTLVFLAFQNRQLAMETRLSSQVAGASAMREATRHIDDTLLVFVERPSLRKYFYGSAPIPKDPSVVAQIETIAEVLADCFDSTLCVARSLTAFSPNEDDWAESALQMWQTSPIFRRTVVAGSIWPDLTRHLMARGVFP